MTGISPTVSPTSQLLKTSEVSPYNFKSAEIGDIPPEWNVVQLTEAATLSRKPRSLNLAEYDTIQKDRSIEAAFLFRLSAPSNYDKIKKAPS
jgi:hypothetical protein